MRLLLIAVVLWSLTACKPESQTRARAAQDYPDAEVTLDPGETLKFIIRKKDGSVVFRQYPIFWQDEQMLEIPLFPKRSCTP